MILKTKEFNDVASAILVAVNNNDETNNLELLTKDGSLRLNVTDREYYVSKILPLDDPEELHAVVKAGDFLEYVGSLMAPEFSIDVKDNNLVVKVGKSNRKFPMIYENDSLMRLDPIVIGNVTVDMPVSCDILQSILNVNSKELTKVKNLDVNELQKLYYIDETGCFTFTTGATLNGFTLEKPIKLLLKDKIVKLFKLFKEDAKLFYGIDALADGSIQTKVAFTTKDTYVAAVVNCDDVLINKIQGPCAATKGFIAESYSNRVVVSATEFDAAVTRILNSYKRNVDAASARAISATITFTDTDFALTDTFGNVESVAIQNGSQVDTDYSLNINLADLKLVLDSCKGEHITMNCGNKRSVVITRGAISNLIPENRRA